VKSDILFHLFYSDERNQEQLIQFLKSMLRLPDEDYQNLVISDPHLHREFTGDKLAIIDVKLYTRNGKVIHIEIQLKVTKELHKRILFYNAKLLTEQLGSGDKYESIQKVISILITDEDIIPVNSVKLKDDSDGKRPAERYHHRFTFYDPEAGVEFSDILEIHTLELGKLPKDADGTALYDWAKFIAADSDEEMDDIAARNPEVEKAVVKYREMTAEEKVRDIYERREKERRDFEMYMDSARWEQKLIIARNLIGANIPFDQIVAFTGLTRDEVEELCV